MLYVWLGLGEGVPAVVQGVIIGMLLGLAVAASLIGTGMMADRLARRRPRAVPPRPKPVVVRFVGQPEEYSSLLDQFTEAERIRLRQLRRDYHRRERRPQEAPPEQW
jgi:hypothetical protein